MQITPVTKDLAEKSLPVITAAFATAAHSDGNEAELVANLRQSKTYRPEYDAVAVSDDGRVLGHAMLSLAQVVAADGQQWPIWVLAPVAVLPTEQKRGLGTALIMYLEAMAFGDGIRAISVLGDPAYYGRFGFVPASQYRITAPFTVADENFMVRELQAGGLAQVQGVLRYDPAFGIN
ncbi:GNAT family N-acetyltransferase [Schleiferilactobacillus harbinensis]|uniref:GNAT family N-acetyltransferase n=1 Tax=Schleiferilactobacillus harbinensis TaxID=304207 RepID=UPI0039EB7776